MNQIYVGGFPSSTRRDDLQRHFSSNGAQVHEVIMKKKFAFIEFKRPEEAAQAVKDFDRTQFDGRPLVVELSCKFGLSRFLMCLFNRKRERVSLD